jgi:hypothetical protein
MSYATSFSYKTLSTRNEVQTKCHLCKEQEQKFKQRDNFVIKNRKQFAT